MSGKSRWDYLKGDLHTLQESFQAAESKDSRRVLSGLRLQPQVRYPAAQRSSTAKTGVNHRQEPPLHLWWESHSISNSHLGGYGYPCSARLKALLPLWLPWTVKRLAVYC